MLSIITINYNTQKLLEDCLNSIKRYINIESYEVIVVDNASEEFSEAALKKIIPGITIIHSKENLGFAKANNLAAKQAKGEYLWFLNSDTKLNKDSNISVLIQFLDSHKEYGAAAPLVLDAKNVPQQYQYGYWPAVWRMILEKPVNARVSKNPLHAKYWRWLNADYLPLQSRDVDWVSGAAMMIRKNVFNEVGGFEAEYFLYYEDVDLCRKLWANKQKIRFVKDAQIIHLEGGSEGDMSKKKLIAYHSQDIYFKRWGSPVSRFALHKVRRPYAKRWQKK
ncbi:MAG: glycosyltransferase family 2 protein [Candidatus Saccharibacteria bacterium]